MAKDMNAIDRILVKAAVALLGITGKQGRYLVFIHQYTQLHGVPCAECWVSG